MTPTGEIVSMSEVSYDPVVFGCRGSIRLPDVLPPGDYTVVIVNSDGTYTAIADAIVDDDPPSIAPVMSILNDVDASTAPIIITSAEFEAATNSAEAGSTMPDPATLPPATSDVVANNPIFAVITETGFTPNETVLAIDGTIVRGGATADDSGTITLAALINGVADDTVIALVGQTSNHITTVNLVLPNDIIAERQALLNAGATLPATGAGPLAIWWSMILIGCGAAIRMAHRRPSRRR